MIIFDDLVLPSGLTWRDEFACATVTQSVRRALDGSLVVFYASQSQGRLITLASESDCGWWTRAQVEAVQHRANSPGSSFRLQLHGQDVMVMFRHHEPPAFEAEALLPRSNPQPGDFYLATLKLITV